MSRMLVVKSKKARPARIPRGPGIPASRFGIVSPIPAQIRLNSKFRYRFQLTPGDLGAANAIDCFSSTLQNFMVMAQSATHVAPFVEGVRLRKVRVLGQTTPPSTATLTLVFPPAPVASWPVGGIRRQKTGGVNGSTGLIDLKLTPEPGSVQDMPISTGSTSDVWFSIVAQSTSNAYAITGWVEVTLEYSIQNLVTDDGSTQPASIAPTGVTLNTGQVYLPPLFGDFVSGTPAVNGYPDGWPSFA